MWEKDKLGLELDQYLREKWQFSCENYHPYLNIVGVFYHEIMVYATNWYLGYHDPKDYPKLSFPFLSTKYCKDPYPIESIEDLIHVSRKGSHSFRGSLKNKLFKTISVISANSNVINLGLNSPLKKDGIPSKLSRLYRLDFTKYLKIHLPDTENQIKLLKAILEEIATRIKVPNPQVFIDNFVAFTNVYLTNKPINPKYEVLFAGSTVGLNTRINAAIGMGAGKKVVAFNHGGQQFSIYDEPIISYGELAYCTDYITYGIPNGSFDLQVERIPTRPPKFHYRAAEYKPTGKVTALNKDFKTSRVLYIPTSFSANFRYTPFRDCSDDLYLNWQYQLSEFFDNFSVKPHPKDVASYDRSQVTLENRNVKEAIEDYDVIILDYVSTASAEAFITDKPVVFFDLGIRNLIPMAEELLKQRAYNYSIDLRTDVATQIQESLDDLKLLDVVKSREFVKVFIGDVEKDHSLNLVREIIEAG